MRYLDRGPRVGDRIHVEYETVVTGEDHDSRDGGCVTKVPGYYLTAACPNCDTTPPYTVRVIAPEPAVGDVVTEDMDLPVATIVSGVDQPTLVCVREVDGWWPSWSNKPRRVPPIEHTWQIVRIGGGS